MLAYKVVILSLFVAGAAAGHAAEIHEAVRSRDAAVVQELISSDKSVVNRKDKDGRTPLHVAAGLGDAKMVALLIEKGADANAKDEMGALPLHSAIAGVGRRPVVELLLPKTEDVNVKTAAGVTPLHSAVAMAKIARDKNSLPPAIRNSKQYDEICAQCLEVVRLVVSKGGDVNAKDNKGASPLDLAKGDEEVLNLLRKAEGAK